MRARYAVRGLTFNSESSLYARPFLCCLSTSLPESCRSPNVIAPVGQACPQAVWISPSSIGRLAFWASILTCWIRWVQ